MRFFLLSILLFSIVNASNVYNLNPKSSSIEWVGSKITGKHNGTIKLNSAEVILDDKKIISGIFIVNMLTIKNLDIESLEYRGYLENHLNSEDFFNTEVYPTAKLVILNQIEPDSSSKALGYNSIINCSLTIKGITNQVSIPSKVSVHNNHATAKGSIDINRTLYDIKYKSKSFFPNIGDKLIYDHFTLNFIINVDREWKN